MNEYYLVFHCLQHGEYCYVFFRDIENNWADEY